MFAIATLCALASFAQPVSKEYKIKAVFLFNFTQFVDWSPAAFASPGSPFVIGILGNDPFGAALDETVQNEKVNGHPIIVQRFRDTRELRPCHILFINPEDADQMRDEISVLGKNTLTVSDAGGFLRAGGMIRFFTQDNKIHLQINPDAAKAADLFISSKLLRVSDIYDAKSPR